MKLYKMYFRRVVDGSDWIFGIYSTRAKAKKAYEKYKKMRYKKNWESKVVSWEHIKIDEFVLDGDIPVSRSPLN